MGIPVGRNEYRCARILDKSSSTINGRFDVVTISVSVRKF